MVNRYRVTIVRDKVTWTSKGVAFLLFVRREDAHKAVRAMNRKEVSITLCNDLFHTVFYSFLVAPSSAIWQLIMVVPENLLGEKTTRTRHGVMSVG